MPGKVVIIERFVFSGGWISSRHRHTGPLFVYVIEGSLTVEMENKEPYTIKKGEVFQELPNLVMQARNASSTGPVDFVVFQVLPKGEPFLKRVN